MPLRKFSLWLALAAFAIVPALAGVPALAQDQQPGSIHGHVNDPAKTPIANALVKLSTDGKTPLYTFKTDDDGDYKGSGIKPGTYVVTLYQTADKAVDRFTNVKITSGGDTLQDFDLSREAYLKQLPPEERKKIEQAMKANAKIEAENKDIKKLNGWLKQARADNQAKNYAAAETLMKQATTVKPDASVLWLTLGISQVGQKKYDDGVTSLQKALSIEGASKKPSPEVQAAANNSLGEAYASTNRIPQAETAYDAAAKLQPADAAMYYTNEAIVLSRAGNNDGTVSAADKAITADPKQPIPYYLKGQALIAKATVDPKTQKIVAPPGTVEAYQKYIELAPNGPFVPQAKQILAEVGQKQQTSFRKH